MELKHFTRLAAAAAVGYLAGRATVRIGADLLRSIDDALADFDLGDDSEVTARADDCAATVRHIHEVCGAILHNGPYGFLPLVAEFCYRDDDPFAFQMRLTAEIEMASGELKTDSALWQFAREIIATALDTPGQKIGEGDVAAEYLADREVLILWLTDAGGTQRRLDLDATAVREFVISSFEISDGDGDAFPNVDDAIARLLDGTWQQ